MSHGCSYSDKEKKKLLCLFILIDFFILSILQDYQES